MGFEKSHIFGKVEVDIRSTVAGSIVFQTETPGGVLTNRFAMPIPVTSGRTVLRSRLPGTLQGHLVKTTGTPGTAPAGHWELYGVRVWVRELPTGQWEWFALPVMDTPVEYIPYKILEDPTQGGGASVAFQEFKLPVEPTPEMYQELKLPVEPTPESFTPLPVLEERTPGTYAPAPIPVEPTPAEFSAFKLPVDGTPEQFTTFKLPVEPTGESFVEFAMPVKPTPPVPMWVGVPVDE